MNKMVFENVLEHNFTHVTFNVHEKVHSQSSESPSPSYHNVTAYMFHRRKDIVSVESLAIRTMNMDNAIRSNNVKLGLVRREYSHSLLLSSLYMLVANCTLALLFLSEISSLSAGILARNPASKRQLLTVPMDPLYSP